MITTPYMDKQIMDLSQQPSKDSIDLLNHPQDEDLSSGNGINKEEIVPSYDFQPIRPFGVSSSSQSQNILRAWDPAEFSKSNSTIPPIRSYASLDFIEPSKVIAEKDHVVVDATFVAEIDQIMKKHTDNLLHVLEGVGARLTQLESRSRHLENSVDDLKVSVGNNHGSTEGKMRQLENILREVQSGVQVLKDRQEILEAQMQLAKQQVSKVDQQPESKSSVHLDSEHPQASASQHSQPQHHPTIIFPQPVGALPPPNAPPPPPPQQNPPSVQLLNQFPQNQIPAVPQREPYFPLPGQTQDVPNLQYQLPPSEQPRPPPVAPPAPHQQYQLAPQSQYPQQPPQIPQPHPSLVNPPQLQPSLGHHDEETHYNPSQNYSPSLHQSTSQSPSGPPPPQHLYGVQAGRTSSGFSAGYGLPTRPTEPYNYGGSPPQYSSGTSNINQPQLSAASDTRNSGRGYPQLPTARIVPVPSALPTASELGSGPGSSGSGNKVPIEDVVDKVTNMGFPRDLVRATVRRLTENGQSVDLNVVLDKLMNDGEVQPPRGWFGR